MNKISWIALVICLLALQMNAQTWKPVLRSPSDPQRTKTLKIRPKMNMTIGSLLVKNDSLTKNILYEGFFLGTAKDSLMLDLLNVTGSSVYTNGLQENEIIPGKTYLRENTFDTNQLKIAFTDIHYMDYRNGKLGGWVEIAEPIILGSLLVMIASPFISLDYKEGKLRETRYKNWALGGTIGVAAGFTTVFTFALLGHNHKFLLKPGWPDKNGKVWNLTK